MNTLPPDFPRDLAESLGLQREHGYLPKLAPITDEIRAALKAAHETKGKCI